MADTDLQIINRALQQMGARASIATLAEDSNEARAAALIFPKAVRTILAEHTWNFAGVFTEGFAIYPRVLPPPWRRAYLFPVDGIAVRDVYPPQPLSFSGCSGERKPNFALGRVMLAEGQSVRCVYTNVEDASLLYTLLVNDFGAWEELALTALEALVAAKLAIPLSGDKTLMQTCWQQYQQALLEAKLRDANEDVSVQDFPPDWLLARDIEGERRLESLLRGGQSFPLLGGSELYSGGAEVAGGSGDR